MALREIQSVFDEEIVRIAGLIKPVNFKKNSLTPDTD